MKIGIFGGSYCDSNNSNPTQSWVDIVKSNYDITCYGLSGSSLYYSIQLINAFSTDFDRCILVPPGFGRLTIVNDFSKNLEEKDKHISSLAAAEYKWSSTDDSKLKLIYSAAMEYFTYFYDENKEYYIHRLMLQDLKNKFSDLLIVPAEVLIDVSLMESKALGISSSNFFKYKDMRNCHMTEENNIIFANMIIDYIKVSEFNLHVDMFVKPTSEKFSLYFGPING